MKRLLTMILGIVIAISITACADQGELDYTYLSIEINPSMEMIINSEENVESYSYGNEAAEIVGSGLNLEGLNYEEALHLYLNAAVQTGYIDTERNDNAVAIYACNQENTASAFQLQVEAKLQIYFEENKLGAVVLNQGEVFAETKALALQNNISFAEAKLIQAYLATNEAYTLQNALKMNSNELIEAIGEYQVEFMTEYKAQRESNLEAVKTKLTEQLQTRLEEHTQAVLNDTATQPDTTGVIAKYVNDYEGVKSEFVIRNQERVEYVYAVMNGLVSQFLVGSYIFEDSSEELAYTVTYETYELNSDGTYTESHSWTSIETSEVTTSESSGTWALVDGTLVLTSSDEVVVEFEISGIRISYVTDDDITVTFIKDLFQMGH